MKKTVTNLIPQEIIDGKELTVQGKPEIFIHINKFLAKYDDKKINKIVFLGGLREDLRTIYQYIFTKRIVKETLLLRCGTQIYREVDCSTETSDKLWPQLAVNWLRTNGFLLAFFSYYHNRLKDNKWFSDTDSHEWIKLREYFNKHYLNFIDYINNSQELYSDRKIIFNGIQRFEMNIIKEQVGKIHKSILERYKYEATTDVYDELIDAVTYNIKKAECMLLWNISHKDNLLLLNLILGLDNLHTMTMPIAHEMLSSINIQQRLTSAPDLLIVQFKNAGEFNKMSKDIKDFLQNFEVIELGSGEKQDVIKDKGQVKVSTKQTTKYVFKEEVKYFKIIYEGHELSPIQSYIGLTYIAQLLFNPGTPYTPYSLSQLKTKNDLSEQQINYLSMSKEKLEEEGLSVSKRSITFQKIIDSSTVSQLKKTLKEFENDKVKAEAEGDIDKKIDCEVKIEEINKELINKKKSFGDPNLKKINDSVRNAIKKSKEEIKNISKPLYKHLENCIIKDKAGYRYSPPKPIEWH